MESANLNAIDNPDQLFQHALTEAEAMRQKFTKTILTQKAGTNDVAVTDPVLVTYPALSICTYLPEFVRLISEYLERGFDLKWIMSLHIQTPGKLYERLPLTESLVLPLDALPPLRASLTLRRTGLY